MKDWVIDRYNKGQNEWRIFDINLYMNDNKLTEIILKNHEDPLEYITVIYDLLFNPKWGFAQAFWKGSVCSLCGASLESDEWEYLSSLPDPQSCWYHKRDGCRYPFLIDSYKYNIQQMSITPAVLQYLEQFKDKE